MGSLYPHKNLYIEKLKERCGVGGKKSPFLAIKWMVDSLNIRGAGEAIIMSHCDLIFWGLPDTHNEPQNRLLKENRAGHLSLGPHAPWVKVACV